MILPDVNVLVYAHHEESANHDAYRGWWEEVVNGPGGFGMADVVLSGFMRVTTHARVFETPLRTDVALDALGAIRSRPTCVPISSTPRHWPIFNELCGVTGATGNAVPDAYLAALAMASGGELITADRGFHRYPGLRYRHPLG